MSDALDTYDHHGMTVNIYTDDEPGNPREDYDDSISTLACFHRDYVNGLGDAGHGLDSADFDGWAAMRAHIVGELGAVVCLPVGLLDHSGLSMFVGTVSPWDHGGWDSGQVGWIFATLDQARAWWGDDFDPENPEDVAKLDAGLRAMVAEYDQYLRGDVYGFTVDSPDGERESCWGYYGEKDVRDEAESYAECMAGAYYRRAWEANRRRDDARRWLDGQIAAIGEAA